MLNAKVTLSVRKFTDRLAKHGSSCRKIHSLNAETVCGGMESFNWTKERAMRKRFAYLVGLMLVLVYFSPGYGQTYPNQGPMPITGFPDLDRGSARINALYECIDGCKRSYPPDEEAKIIDCFHYCRKTYGSTR